MKTLDKIKIWKKQARMWMRVCHYAMAMFPEAFTETDHSGPYSLVTPTTPKQSPDIILGLLAELHDRRKGYVPDPATVRVIFPDLPDGAKGWKISSLTCKPNIE